MLTGTRLIEDIDATEPGDGEMAFWWLGQMGFVVKLAETVIYVDPFLSPGERRTVPPLLEPAQIRHADAILGTHDHRDHIDRRAWPALAEASPGARLVAPERIVRNGLARDLGIAEDRVFGLDDGRSVELGNVRITGVPAAHERLDVDPATGLHPYLGYVLEGGGLRVYHAGDTCKWEGLESRLRAFGAFDLVFLPINGRDAERLAGGCIGNMTYQEAVDLAGAIDAALAVPGHFEMFAHNSEDPAKFTDYLRAKYPDVRPLVPEHGRAFRLPADGVSSTS